MDWIIPFMERIAEFFVHTRQGTSFAAENNFISSYIGIWRENQSRQNSFNDLCNFILIEIS
jgi:hypothetical protein